MSIFSTAACCTSAVCHSFSSAPIADASRLPSKGTSASVTTSAAKALTSTFLTVVGKTAFREPVSTVAPSQSTEPAKGIALSCPQPEACALSTRQQRNAKKATRTQRHATRLT